MVCTIVLYEFVLFVLSAFLELVIMAFKSKSSPKRNCVTQLHDYLNKYVTYDSDVCSYELISLSSSIPVKEFSISLLAAEI